MGRGAPQMAHDDHGNTRVRGDLLNYLRIRLQAAGRAAQTDYRKIVWPRTYCADERSAFFSAEDLARMLAAAFTFFMMTPRLR